MRQVFAEALTSQRREHLCCVPKVAFGETVNLFVDAGVCRFCRVLHPTKYVRVGQCADLLSHHICTRQHTIDSVDASGSLRCESTNASSKTLHSASSPRAWFRAGVFSVGTSNCSGTLSNTRSCEHTVKACTDFIHRWSLGMVGEHCHWKV